MTAKVLHTRVFVIIETKIHVVFYLLSPWFKLPEALDISAVGKRRLFHVYSRLFIGMIGAKSSKS